MAGASADGEVNHWPAFVDVLTTVIMVVTFLLVIMSAAVMQLSQRVIQNFKQQMIAQEQARQLADPRPLLRPVSDAVAELARNQNEMLSQFRVLYEDAEADRAHIRATLAALGTVVERSRLLDGRELHAQLDRLIAAQADAAGRAGPPLTMEPAGPAAAPGLVGRILGAAGLGDPASRRAVDEARAIRREVREGMAGSRRAVCKLAGGLHQRLDRLEATGGHDRDALARLMARAAQQQAALDLLAARLESAPDCDEPGLSGARAGMEMLRRRLDARLDETAAQAVDAPARRFGTTD